MKRFATLLPGLLLCLMSLPLAAQPELMAAVQYGYPFLLDRQGYYNSAAGAVTLQAGWRLPQSRLYPSVRLSFGGMQVAVQAPASGFDDLNTEVQTFGALLLLSTLLRSNEKTEWLLSGGLGVTGMSAYTKFVSSGANGSVAAMESLNGRLKPCATGIIGLRWLHRILYERPLYLSGELNGQYIYLTGKEEYRLLFPRAVIPATVRGQLLMPAAQLGLCWKFE